MNDGQVALRPQISHKGVDRVKLLYRSTIHTMTAVVPKVRVETVAVANEGKATTSDGCTIPIRTGIGYFDHMLDQWNSHAQVGVGVIVVNDDDKETTSTTYDPNWLAGQNQVELCTVVGHALGKALYRDILCKMTKASSSSRFCCPLDEALVECIISPPSSSNEDEDAGGALTYDVAPYGSYPKGGRTHIGSLETFSIESFWKAFAESSKLDLSFKKIRGINGHHIVESSFKAFSRALRNYLDKADLWSVGGPNHKATQALARVGKVERSTKETSISVELCLDVSDNEDDPEEGALKNSPENQINQIDTGIPVLDEFYRVLAREAHIGLRIKCDGDTWVDDHHTAEDVSIAVGQCLTQALGDKAGLNRMWLADDCVLPMDDALIEVTMDLSNRPCLVHHLHDTLAGQEYCDSDEDIFIDRTGTRLSVEMFEHCLESLVTNARMTVHVVKMEDHKNCYNVFKIVRSTATAFGKALRVCAMVDPRRAGKTASSKGTLSV